MNWLTTCFAALTSDFVCHYPRFSSYTEWNAYIITVATVLGAWVGAFSIPLDWNQPWQVMSDCLCTCIAGVHGPRDVKLPG